MKLFTLLTPVIYWILILLWTFIFLFYLKSRRKRSSTDKLTIILFTILAIDSLRTLIESLFFGAWYTALAGMIPSAIHEFLVRPEIVFIPKFLNLVVAIIIISILLYRWIPQEASEKKHFQDLLEERTAELERSNRELQKGIIERETAEKKTIETKLFYESIIESVQDGIWVTNNEDIIFYANTAMEKIAGVSRTYIEGKHILKDFPPETTGELSSYYLRAKKEQIPVWYDIQVKTPDNRNTWQNGWVIPRYSQGEYQGIICSIRDVTKQKEVEERLIQNENNLSITLNSIGDGVIATDRDGSITRMNRVAETLTGWTVDEALGNQLDKVFRLVDADTREVVDNPVHNIIQQARIIEITKATLLLAKDGRIRRISNSGAPIKDQQGVITGVVLVFRDITNQYKMEEQLLQAQKMDAVGQLAGGIAHDFNNMLAGIMGCAELIGTVVHEPEKVKEYVDLIMDSSMQAAELTQKLLSFSRKNQLQKAPFDLHLIISKAFTILERSIDKRILIHTSLQAEYSTVYGDASQIQSALLNFGINARDAMPQGGSLTITTRNKKAAAGNGQKSQTAENTQYIEITIEDTGVGIREEIKDRIFEPFFTTKGLGKGTGLGLSIAYTAIRENHGVIDIDSELGKGTCITILLPVCETEQPVGEKQIQEKNHHGEGTILIIDDERIVRIIAEQLLQDLGYSTITASDGKEGLAIYREQWEHIDLVLLDIIMPKMNGREVFYELQKINPKVKVLLCSGYQQDTNTLQLIEEGAKGFIPKPFKEVDLSHTVFEALK